MSAALAGPTALPVSHVEHCMGTVFSFRVLAPGVDRRALDAAVARLHAIDATFSTYRPDSEISRINAGTLRVDDASDDVQDVLAACERFRRETGGYFDPRCNGILDPSGYVKGWAVEQAARLLAAAGSVNHCVNGGGDVICAGRPQAGRGWRVGIADPFRRGDRLTTVEAAGPLAVATSGPAERGAHITDPHTGEAAAGIASATVVATDLVTADVYATAAVAMGPARATEWLADRPTVRALLVTADGQQRHLGPWVGPN